MRNFWLSLAGATLALTLLAHPRAVLAQDQQNPGWFVPNQPRPAAQPGRAAPPQATAPAEAVPEPIAPVDEQGATPQQQIQVHLPPPPEIPPIPKGPPTPAAIVGIVSIPDALRVSTAYEAADKAFNERHKKLDEDAQKEQVTLRDQGQQLANDRAKLSPEQIRQRERELQDRIAESRRKFGERNRVIQESGQYVMAQINRTMEQVVQQVALARGINVVLNRAQVLGTTADFDLTPQVVQVLNKVLPSVVIPPDGVSPLAMGPPKAEPGATAAAKPASATKPGAPAKPATSGPTKH
ncbi:MAG TPA: OmpH family outer membrane protein [Acetobacteraceae bacterium]